MPYVIQWESEGVYTKYWGDLTVEELNEALRSKRDDPRMPNCRYSISDFLDVTQTSVTKFAVLLLAAKDHDSEAVSRSIKIAHVMDNAGLKDLSLTYKKSPLIRDSLMVDIFDTLEDARAWVNA